MVYFGLVTEKLEANKRPEWADQYMDYAALKAIIDLIVQKEKASATPDAAASCTSVAVGDTRTTPAQAAAPPAARSDCGSAADDLSTPLLASEPRLTVAWARAPQAAAAPPASPNAVQSGRAPRPAVTSAVPSSAVPSAVTSAVTPAVTSAVTPAVTPAAADMRAASPASAEPKPTGPDTCPDKAVWAPKSGPAPKSGSPSKSGSPGFPGSPDSKLGRARMFASGFSRSSSRKSIVEAGLADPSLRFHRAFEAQSDRVNTFFVDTFNSLSEQLEFYLPRLQQMNRGTLHAHAEPIPPIPSGGGAGASDGDRKPSHLFSVHDRSSLRRAVSQLYRELQQLRNFCILNYTGFIKIVKKHDKSVPPRLRRKNELMDRLNQLAFISHEGVDRIAAELESGFAEAFCDGNVQVARADLLVRRERSRLWHQFGIGLRLGVAATLAVWLLWDLCIDTRVLDLRPARQARLQIFLEYEVPIYRLALSLTLGCYLWAATCYLWSRARVNYLFLFELRDEEVLGVYESLILGTQQLTLVLVSLLLFSKSILSELPPHINAGIFPAVLFLLITSSLLLPRKRGSRLLEALRHVFSAPFVPVTLWTSFIGDVLTSLVKPLIDLVYSACYILTLEFAYPDPQQGRCHDLLWKQTLAAPILIALPLLCRFLQNLRVAHDTHKRVPALPNALKYATALLVVFFGALHPSFTSSAYTRAEGSPAAWIQVGWLVAYLGSTLYTFVWDVSMDWRLLPWQDVATCRYREHALREKTMVFRSRRAYYGVIAADLVLRFGWTATLAPGIITNLFADAGMAASPTVVLTQSIQVLVPMIEMVRRAFWAVLRLEAEHLYNTEGFRRINDIPMHFDRKTKEKADVEPKTRMQLLMELGTYLLLLGALAILSALTRQRSPEE